MLGNLKFAVRQLIKSPGFTVVAVGTLALGIGACTVMFSILNAVLLKPLPFREPERLVWIENVYNKGGLSGRTTQADVFKGWREQTKSFEALAGYFAFFDYNRLIVRGTGTPEQLRGVGVTDNFLPTLGIPLELGRNFTADECRTNGPGAAILGYGYWHRRYSGDPSVVGRTITIDSRPTTIVGVLPRSFDFSAIFSPGTEVELLIPFPISPETASWGNTLFGIGRLRPRATVQQAQAELSVISRRLRETEVKTIGNFGAYIQPLGMALCGRFRSAFLILAGAVACVFVIACVNLSNLLLARVNVRRQEFAIRAALGARRRHLVQQTLTESLLLAFLGTSIGVPAAYWATLGLAHLRTFGIPMLQSATVDPLALAVTVALMSLAGVACGVLPAVHLLGGRRKDALIGATHQRTASRVSTWSRNGLVIVEVSLACMLLVGSSLLLRSFNSLLQVNLGFQPHHAVAWRIDPPREFKSAADREGYLDGLTQRIAQLPGVEQVGITDTLPLGRNRMWGIRPTDAKEHDIDRGAAAFPRVIDQHYLHTMRIPLLAGRYFDGRDGEKEQKTIIVNQSLAHRLWSDQDPIGKMVALNFNLGDFRVVGVVADVRHSSLEESGGYEMYLGYRQIGIWAIDMVVRSVRPPKSLVPDVRAALLAYDPDLPSGESLELDHLVDDAVAPRRLITQLLGFFSALALALAALGLYGVISYSVGQRVQEIGIRMAVGAQRRDILDLILRGGMKLIFVGVLTGIVGALALGKVLQSMLFGVTGHDPLVFAADAALLGLVGVIACIVPAMRATRVDPMTALRAE